MCLKRWHIAFHRTESIVCIRKIINTISIFRYPKYMCFQTLSLLVSSRLLPCRQSPPLPPKVLNQEKCCFFFFTMFWSWNNKGFYFLACLLLLVFIYNILAIALLIVTEKTISLQGKFSLIISHDIKFIINCNY